MKYHFLIAYKNVYSFVTKFTHLDECLDLQVIKMTSECPCSFFMSKTDHRVNNTIVIIPAIFWDLRYKRLRCPKYKCVIFGIRIIGRYTNFKYMNWETKIWHSLNYCGQKVNVYKFLQILLFYYLGFIYRHYTTCEISWSVFLMHVYFQTRMAPSK